MYSIYELNTGCYQCNCTIQDGVEQWTEPTLEKAMQSLISAAYALNGVRINKTFVKIVYANSIAGTLPATPNSLEKAAEEAKLLQQIKAGYKTVLDYDDFRLKSNLLEEEVELVIAIREGRAKVIYDH